MKAITRKADDVAVYLLPDDATVTMQKDKIVIENAVVADLGSANATLHEGVSGPESWEGGKYTYTASDGWNLA